MKRGIGGDVLLRCVCVVGHETSWFCGGEEEMELMKTMGHTARYSQMAAFRECWKRHGNVKRTGARDVEGAQTKLG